MVIRVHDFKSTSHIQFAIAKEKSELHHQRQQLIFLSSEESLMLIPEYRQRLEVRKVVFEICTHSQTIGAGSEESWIRQ